MLWPCTLIGAGLGYAAAGIPGTMLGALLGQAADRRLSLRSWAHLRARFGGPSVPRNDELLFILLGRVAKADGRVQEAHIHQARGEMSRLDMGEPARKRAIAAFNRGKEGKDNLKGLIKRLKNQPNAAEGLLRACWRMAWADGQISMAERQLLRQWGGWLSWPADKVDALSAQDEAVKATPAVPVNRYQDALRLLGVGSDTAPDGVKRAYRRLLSKHHPDKLAGSGASERQVREATEKTRELHNAYTLVRERHGF